MTKVKAVPFKRVITDNAIIKQIKEKTKRIDNFNIAVSVWDYTDYRVGNEDNIDSCNLFLEVFINSEDIEDVFAIEVVNIPQEQILEEQVDPTGDKLLKLCEKIGAKLQEAFSEVVAEYDDNDDPIFKQINFRIDSEKMLYC